MHRLLSKCVDRANRRCRLQSLLRSDTTERPALDLEPRVGFFFALTQEADVDPTSRRPKPLERSSGRRNGLLKAWMAGKGNGKNLVQ